MRGEEKTEADSGAGALSRADQWQVAPKDSFITDDDLHLFNEGTHARLYEKLGAHRAKIGGSKGTYFAVWAPNADAVSVTGNFNDWDKESHPLSRRANSGIWEGFIPGVDNGALYKYFIRSRFMDYRADKADPFSVFNEIPPKTASIVWDLDYAWGDRDWMARRRECNALTKPISIYEMHLGSWRRVPGRGKPLAFVSRDGAFAGGLS